VTRSEYEAANVAEADGRHGRSADGGALLAGILRCASCGHTLTRVSNGARGYRNYQCRKRHGDGICSAPASISVPRADDYVASEFLAALEREPLAAKGEPADSGLERAVDVLEAAERELSEYQAANLISVIGQEAFREGVSLRQERIEAARQAVGEVSAGSPLAGVRDLRSLWPDLHVAERRQLLASVLEQVVVVPAPGAGRGAAVGKRLKIVWR
jgi:hypothetical protein